MYRLPRSGFDRVPFTQVCEFATDGTRARALICNLSILGAYVHIETPPTTDSRVMLTFRLPDDGPVVLAEASVTWVNDVPADSATALPIGCGVRFQSVAPDDLRRIASLVSSFLAARPEQHQVGVGKPPSGKERVPFIAACRFEGEEGEARGSICNLSTLGVYAALDRIPEVGERGRVSFAVPGLAGNFEADVTVAWHNPEYGQRMHALPPGCGLRFDDLAPLDEAVLTTLVSEYLTSVAAG
ncbi:MAG: PilZ domain-containing protein [Thermoanaerobaculia bacterium]